MKSELFYIGKKYGRFTVSRESARERPFPYRRCMLCVCECGKKKSIRLTALLQGSIKSCGCLFDETIEKRRTANGLGKTVEYHAWQNMKLRCYSPKNSHFKNYGARGIVVSSDWLKFENFYRDMGKRPKGTSLDRIDNNGNYCKDNCRWGTQYEQSNNRTNTKRLTYKGITKSAKQWSDDLGISPKNILARLKYGWSVEEALITPIFK